MASTDRAHPPVRLRVKLLALGLGLAVAFTAAEITLRLTRPPVDLAVMTGRDVGPNPMSRWAEEDAFCAYRAIPSEPRNGKSVNADGFISTPELAVEKEEGVLRIAFLGGSSTAGTTPELADPDTWPWRVAERLRAARPGRRIEFLNGALGGYTSFESFGRLWSRIRFYRPDVVVVDHAWNEMYYFGRVDAAHRFRTLPDGGWSVHRRTLWLEFPPHWIDPYIEWSCLLTHVRRWLAPRRGECSAPRPDLAADFDPRGVDVYRTNLRLMRDAQKALGYRLYVVKQPTLIVPDLPTEDRKRCHYELHGFDHDAHVRAFAAIYRMIDEEIPPERILDATALSGRTDLFADHVHPTRKGARELAAVVAGGLLGELQ